MFKKTLNFSELKSDPSTISDIQDGDVVQVFHRGQDVKVMMTQEYFFSLMSRLEKAEKVSKRADYNPDQLMADFDSKMKKLDSLIGKVENKEKVS